MILPVEFAKQLTIRGIPVLASLVADDQNGAEPNVEKFPALVARLCTKDAVRDVAVESCACDDTLLFAPELPLADEDSWASMAFCTRLVS
jgi:hypothetical protein